MKYKLVSVIAMSAGRHANAIRLGLRRTGQPIARFDPFVVFVGGRNRCSLSTLRRNNAYVECLHLTQAHLVSGMAQSYEVVDACRKFTLRAAAGIAC